VGPRICASGLDYDRAIQFDPAHLPALFNRGIASFRAAPMGPGAGPALDRGGDPATVHYDLALVYNARNDRSEAPPTSTRP
jgi:hypothetical protein